MKPAFRVTFEGSVSWSSKSRFRVYAPGTIEPWGRRKDKEQPDDELEFDTAETPDSKASTWRYEW